ncbi:hypothetical protein Pelo_17291 [Pelomyxa schiedti]|nr:hypothetical protein Pelo_17291 [Pelomyxa schiedti]
MNTRSAMAVTVEPFPRLKLEEVVKPDPFEIARRRVVPLKDEPVRGHPVVCEFPIMEALALLTGSHTRCGASSPARTLCVELFKEICLFLWHIPAGNYLVQIDFTGLRMYNEREVPMYITINESGDIVQAASAEHFTYWCAGEKAPFGHIDSNTMSLEIKHTYYGGLGGSTNSFTMPSLQWTTRALLQGSVTHHHFRSPSHKEAVQGQASLSFQGKLGEPDNLETTTTEIVAQCAKQEAIAIADTAFLT